MMAQLEHGHCTARSTVLAAPPAMVKDKSGEGGQTAVGLDPINEGVQPDVLQRGRAGMARQRSKSHDVRTATWNVSSMVRLWMLYTEERLISVVLKRRDGRVKVRRYLVLMVEDVKFVPKPRGWKLKDEETDRLFTHEMAARNDEVTKADDIQKKWLLMKETWLKGSKQVCGMTKGPPRHKETWWWNRDVEKVVAKRKVCHKAWQKSKSAEDKHALDVAKKEVYTAVMTAQESKLQEFTADLQS